MKNLNSFLKIFALAIIFGSASGLNATNLNEAISVVEKGNFDIAPIVWCTEVTIIFEDQEGNQAWISYSICQLGGTTFYWFGAATQDEATELSEEIRDDFDPNTLILEVSDVLKDHPELLDRGSLTIAKPVKINDKRKLSAGKYPVRNNLMVVPMRE